MMRNLPLFISTLILFTTITGLSISTGCKNHNSSERPSQSVSNEKAPPENNRRVRIGPNISIPSQFNTLPIVEPHISAHPSNNDHLLVAAMVVTDKTRPYESCRLSSFLSTNGGKTWKETAHNWWGYDPWTAFSSDGNAAIGWIGTPGSFQDKYPIIFLRSADGGATWDPTQELKGEHDGTKLTPFNNMFYFTTVRFRGHMAADIFLYGSTDGGPFQQTGMIDGNGERLNFAEPAILTDGTVVVPSLFFKKKAWANVSTDGGKTFTAHEITGKLGGGARGYSHLISDVRSIHFKDRLYFLRASGYDQDYSGIWLNYSTDKGSTWSRDIRVDSFPRANKSRAVVPSIAINKNGIVGVSWADSQEDSAGMKNDLYFSFSEDGGKTFQNPVRITDVSSDPRTSANDDVANKFPGGGHYLGLAAKSDGSFQMVWSDSRSGLFQLQTCNVVIE